MLSWLRKVFSGAPASVDALAFAHGLPWIAATDNPWGENILDCRSITQQWQPATTNSHLPLRFQELRESDGTQHVACDPLPTAVELGFRLNLAEAPPEGPLFQAISASEKWDLFHLQGSLYAAHSWTGELLHTARMRHEEGMLVFDNLRSTNPYAGYARRDLHFLFCSLYLRWLLPCPLPGSDETHPTAHHEKALAGWHTFETFGRFGWFATLTDMSQKPLVAKSTLKEWLAANPVR